MMGAWRRLLGPAAEERRGERTGVPDKGFEDAFQGEVP
jgi:hypothetical protein